MDEKPNKAKESAADVALGALWTGCILLFVLAIAGVFIVLVIVPPPIGLVFAIPPGLVAIVASIVAYVIGRREKPTTTGHKSSAPKN